MSILLGIMLFLQIIFVVITIMIFLSSVVNYVLLVGAMFKEKSPEQFKELFESDDYKKEIEELSSKYTNEELAEKYKKQMYVVGCYSWLFKKLSLK